MEPKGDIALIGLAVMGQNLILNMNDNGFTVVAYNRTVSKVDDFMDGEAKGTNIIGARSIEEMVSHLKRPRRVMMAFQNAGGGSDSHPWWLLDMLDEPQMVFVGLFRGQSIHITATGGMVPIREGLVHGFPFGSRSFWRCSGHLFNGNGG